MAIEVVMRNFCGWTMVTTSDSSQNQSHSLLDFLIRSSNIDATDEDGNSFLHLAALQGKTIPIKINLLTLLNVPVILREHRVSNQMHRIWLWPQPPQQRRKNTPTFRCRKRGWKHGSAVAFSGSQKRRQRLRRRDTCLRSRPKRNNQCSQAVISCNRKRQQKGWKPATRSRPNNNRGWWNASHVTEIWRRR